MFLFNSLRNKTIALNLVVFLTALGIFTYVMVDSIRIDKTTYIIETLFNKLQERERVTVSLVSNLSSIHEVAINASLNNLPLSRVLRYNNELVRMQILLQSNEKRKFPKNLSFLNRRFLKKNEISEKSIEAITNIKRKTKEKCQFNTRYWWLKDLPSKKGKIIKICEYDAESNVLVISHWESNLLLNGLDQVTPGDLLIRTQSNRKIIFSSSKNPKLAMGNLLKEEKTQISINGNKYFASYKKIPNTSLEFAYLIPYEIIEAPIKAIYRQVIQIALLLSFISIIISYLFTRYTIGPIEKLTSVTKVISQGKFDIKIRTKGKDEVSILASAFNKMTKEIQKYIEKQKDTVRMEQELAVASLVQDSFFPAQDLIKLGRSEIFGYYKSASECGGDWWGYDETSNNIILYIADATGHGVPAALITATANCCAVLMKDLIKYRQTDFNSAVPIVDYMNQAVCSVGGQVMMTFFVAVINKNTGKVTYSNASHNFPLLLRKDGSTTPVISESQGVRLGQDSGSTYSEDTINLNSGDSLILLTDGILEATNKEKKQWGERRFKKSVESHASESTYELTVKVINDAIGFYEGIRPDDDLTIVTFRHNVG